MITSMLRNTVSTEMEDITKMDTLWEGECLGFLQEVFKRCGKQTSTPSIIRGGLLL